VIRIFVIDHLHRIRYDRNQDLRHEIGDFCQRLTDFAKDSHSLIILCAQLNRESARMQRAPILSDLAESGQIEQHADIVLAVYPGKDSSGKDSKTILVMNLLKNRHGPNASSEFRVTWEHQRFEELEKKENKCSTSPQHGYTKPAFSR